MKTVSVKVDILVDDLMRIAKQELGMEPVAAVPDAALRPSFYRRTEAVNSAIQHVLRATDRADKAQYSHDEQRALSSLFAAAKRLRSALGEEAKAKTTKGEFHV
jgi:hypothetical protein